MLSDLACGDYSKEGMAVGCIQDLADEPPHDLASLFVSHPPPAHAASAPHVPIDFLSIG